MALMIVEIDTFDSADQSKVLAAIRRHADVLSADRIDGEA